MSDLEKRAKLAFTELQAIENAATQGTGRSFVADGLMDRLVRLYCADKLASAIADTEPMPEDTGFV